MIGPITFKIRVLKLSEFFHRTNPIQNHECSGKILVGQINDFVKKKKKKKKKKKNKQTNKQNQ